MLRLLFNGCIKCQWSKCNDYIQRHKHYRKEFDKSYVYVGENTILLRGCKEVGECCLPEMTARARISATVFMVDG